MEEVGSYEAKTHLPKLLDRVANGERITITRHGTPVALLSPAVPERKKPVSVAITELREFRKAHTLGEISLRNLIEEGRR